MEIIDQMLLHPDRFPDWYIRVASINKHQGSAQNFPLWDKTG